MELPPAESCALDDGEEDEIQFSQKTQKSILNKLNTRKVNIIYILSSLILKLLNK